MGTINRHRLQIKTLGQQDYQSTWQAMQDFTLARDKMTPDEIWVVEHPAVFTLGRNGKREHILCETDIPIINVDRGGQVTYHGPGQLIIYLLLDLHRRNIGIRKLVTLIEDALVELLSQYQIQAYSDKKAPGVYVDKKKIAALGLRVSKGCTTHGLSLNVNMDLLPFKSINPCGYKDLEVTQCIDLSIKDDVPLLAEKLSGLLDTALKRFE